MKILIVDDLAANRYLLETILRSEGYEFVSAANGIEALNLLRTDTFDLIISDILMPKMDGFQLLRECMKDPRLKKIPFIIYTATYTEKKDEVFGLSLGAIRYIIKPSEPAALFQSIKEVLSEHAHSPRNYSDWPVPDDETFAQEYTSRIGAKLEKKVHLLEESEEKFRLLYENSMDAIFLTSPDGSIQAANPAACAMFQQTEDEIIRNGRAGIIDATDPRLLTALEERKRIGQFKGELNFMRKDKTLFPGEVSSNLFTDHDGQTRSSMIIRDISERKRAEEELVCKHKELNTAYEQLTANETVLQQNYAELEKSQRSLRQTTDYLNNLLDYANAPIIVWDSSQRITRFNHAFERMTGLKEEEVIGQPLDILFPPKNRKTSLDLIQRTMSGEYWETVDIPILHVNGSTRTVLWNSATLFDEDKTKVVAIIAQGQDITKRKLAEDTLVRVNQKLNVITALTRRDLTSEVFVLTSYLELLKKQAAGQDRILEIIKKCSRAITYITAITEFTKEFQDMGAKPPQWQNVNIVFLFGLSHVTMGEIKNRIETETLEIFADPLFEKVCQRLFENSLVHGDHVSLIHIWYTANQQELTIFFEDDGIGIPQETKEKIFSKDDVSHGPMRSLIFVREILDITGITIRETGEPGKGARFEIVVPNGAWRTTEKGT